MPSLPWQAAVSAYSQYLSIVDKPASHPVSPFVLLEMVDVYVYSRQWPTALTVLQQLTKNFPTFRRYKKAVWHVAMVLLQLHRYGECLEYLQFCQSAPPLRVRAWEVMMVTARVQELAAGEPNPQLYQAALAARTDINRADTARTNNSLSRACLSLADVFTRRREFVIVLVFLEKFFELKGGMAAFLTDHRSRTLRRRQRPSSAYVSLVTPIQWAAYAECYAIARDDLKTVDVLLLLFMLFASY